MHANDLVLTSLSRTQYNNDHKTAQFLISWYPLAKEHIRVDVVNHNPVVSLCVLRGSLLPFVPVNVIL